MLDGPQRSLKICIATCLRRSHADQWEYSLAPLTHCLSLGQIRSSRRLPGTLTNRPLSTKSRFSRDAAVWTSIAHDPVRVREPRPLQLDDKEAFVTLNAMEERWN
jgi:hypothetical protein